MSENRRRGKPLTDRSVPMLGRSSSNREEEEEYYEEEEEYYDEDEYYDENGEQHQLQHAPRQVSLHCLVDGETMPCNEIAARIRHVLARTNVPPRDQQVLVYVAEDRDGIPEWDVLAETFNLEFKVLGSGKNEKWRNVPKEDLQRAVAQEV